MASLKQKSPKIWVVLELLTKVVSLFINLKTLLDIIL